MSAERSLLSSLATDAAASGVRLSHPQQQQLAHFRDLLLEWNARFNLTAIRDPAEVEQRLFLDAIRMLSPIERRLVNEGTAPKLVDVGTGAGFPGMVLSILRPSWSITLVEATGKKVRFLEEVVTDLDLNQVVPVHARAEEIGQNPTYRGTYDIAVARAVASLPALLELCAPLLRPNGHAFFPKSTAIDAEIHAGRHAAPVVGMTLNHHEVLPGSETRLVVAEKTGTTPAQYPRRPGIPAREPLRGVVPAEPALRGGTG